MIDTSLSLVELILLWWLFVVDDVDEETIAPPREDD